MATCANSTTAPARPLLPLPALDRRAIGRDGWVRAREIAAQLGGEIRDHVAEGMRQAWAAARGLLQADCPAQSRSVDSPNAAGVVPPLLPLPAPLPSLTAALSRRRAIFGAVVVAAVPAVALPAAASTPRPRGPLTLAQAEALDFTALWRSLPTATQARLGAMVLRHEMMLQLEEDGGFHTTADDRSAATTLASDVQAELRPAIWAALPDVMPMVYDELYSLWQALDDRHPPAEIDVRDLGRVPLVNDGWEWFAVGATARHKLGGAVDLNSRDEDAPRAWLFWTAADIDVERLRRHPEMAGAPV